ASELQFFPARRSSDLGDCGFSSLPHLRLARLPNGLAPPDGLEYAAACFPLSFPLFLQPYQKGHPISGRDASQGSPHLLSNGRPRSEEHTSELQSRENL